jgi:hypothetical protein
MSRIKFTSLDVDKSASQLSNDIKKRSLKTRVTNGIVQASDVSPGEFVFTSLKKGQEGPSTPNTDESIYFKDKDGNFFKFTGTKVG